MRLIDADECTSVETMKAFPAFKEVLRNVTYLKELVDSVLNDKTEYSCKCSVCNRRSFSYSLCPHCGARMDLK